MSMNEVGPMGTKEMVLTYEEAMKEFATSAAEFLEHIPLLTKARDSCQRAMAVSNQLRGTLDSGDEILRTLMAKVEQAVDAQPGNSSDKKTPDAFNVETIKASGEKANGARA